MDTNTNDEKDTASNSEKQANDKAPGEERGKAELVKPENLKGKSVDADPSTEEGKPVETDKS